MKKILLSMCLVVGAALLAGCGGDQENNNDQAGGGEASQEQNQKNQPQEEMGKTTLQALSKMGKDVVCTYEIPEQDNMKGTIYVAHNGQKIRSENTSSGDMEYSNMIMDLDKKMMHSWTKTKKMEEAMGMKMGLNNLEEYGEKAEDAQNQEGASASPMGPKPQEQIDYDCSDWKVDDSKFNPPSDVQFMDLTGMMEGLQQNMPTSPEDVPEMPEDMPETIPTY